MHVIPNVNFQAIEASCNLTHYWISRSVTRWREIRILGVPVLSDSLWLYRGDFNLFFNPCLKHFTMHFVSMHFVSVHFVSIFRYTCVYKDIYDIARIKQDKQCVFKIFYSSSVLLPIFYKIIHLEQHSQLIYNRMIEFLNWQTFGTRLNWYEAGNT